MTERRALAWLAIGALLAIAWLAHPFATALLLGALLAFTLEPFYQRLVRYTGRPLLASLVPVGASAVLIAGALSGFVSIFVARAAELAASARDQLQGSATTGWIDAITRWLGRFGISAGSLTGRLEAGAGEIASRAAAMAASLASGTFTALLGLFFALLTMYFVLRYWPRMAATLVLVSPLDAEYTRALLGEFYRVGRMTMSGTVVTGLAQGALAAIGYWITGVPQPVFFGMLTALASLLPAVGTLLVWVPAGIYLFARGHPARAGIELLWGALVVVGFSDYVIRPRLVGREAMPTLLVFIALFGGLEVLGVSGLIWGPVIMALAVAVLRLYARDKLARRGAK